MNSAYEELIEKVRAVNPLAATWLEHPLSNVQHSNRLYSVMVWASTPQGHDYWEAISNQIGERQ
jgi:hypothetical protein